MSDRNRQKQIWSDEAFVLELKKLMALRLLNGNPVKNIGQLTKEILESSSWKNITKELLESDRQFQIKIDRKRF